jgi:hypothetical protein
MGAVAVGAGGLAERREEPAERAGVRDAEQRDPPRSQCGQVAVERLGEQRVREVGLVLRRARGEHRRVAGRGGEVREQARLADPRLALDRHHAAPRPQRRLDRRALHGAADQRSGRQRGHGASLPQTPRAG